LTRRLSTFKLPPGDFPIKMDGDEHRAKFPCWFLPTFERGLRQVNGDACR